LAPALHYINSKGRLSYNSYEFIKDARNPVSKEKYPDVYRNFGTGGGGGGLGARLELFAKF